MVRLQGWISQRVNTIYLVCGNTMCVSTCQVEFALRELSLYILLPRSRFIGCSGDFSVMQRTVLLFNNYPGRRYRKLAGTTTLAYRLMIICTTAESILELVLMVRLACSSHRQSFILLMGRKTVGLVWCVTHIKNPVHLSKSEGVSPGIPGLIGSIWHHCTLWIFTWYFKGKGLIKM